MPLRHASAVAVLLFCAPTFGLNALSPTDPSLQGTTIASQSVPIPSIFFEQGISQDSTPLLLVDEKVVRNTAGTLDFYYKVRNPPNESYLLEDFNLEFPAGDGLDLSFAYLDEGNLAPITASIGNGNPPTTMFAGYAFGLQYNLDGVPLPDAGTDWLLVRSNTSGYVTGTLSAVRWHDDFIGNAPGFVPDASTVPEPNTLALLSVPIIGLALKSRRR
jgi:hypothetical protein